MRDIKIHVQTSPYRYGIPYLYSDSFTLLYHYQQILFPIRVWLGIILVWAFDLGNPYANEDHRCTDF